MWVFDFDGVMMDSIDEVMVSGYNAASGKDARKLEDLPANFIPLFRENRCRVKNAPEIVLLAEWALRLMDTDSPHSILTTDDLAQTELKSPASAAKREDTFFTGRAKFMKLDRDAWLDLNRPFEPLWSALLGGNPEEVNILTYKNRAAVMEICHHFKLNVLAENVYSGDNGMGKIENFEKLFARHRLPEYHFVDDSVRNLEDLQQTFSAEQNLTLYFADWGYTAPEDRGRVADLDIDSYEIDAFVTVYKPGFEVKTRRIDPQP